MKVVIVCREALRYYCLIFSLAVRALKGPWQEKIKLTSAVRSYQHGPSGLVFHVCFAHI